MEDPRSPSGRRRAAPRRPRVRGLAAFLLALLLSACGATDPLEEIRQRQMRGDYAGTLEPLRELLAERRADGEINFLYGLALTAMGEFGAASWPLRQAMEDPEWRKAAALHLIRAGLMGRDFKEVVELSNRLLEDDPDDSLALLYRAQANAYWNYPEEAVVDARRVLELEPERLEAYEPLIIALLALDRYDEAGEELAEAGRRLEETGSPASSMAWHCSTSAIFAAEANPDHPEEARELWDQCTEKYPTDATVVGNAVEFFDALGERARSMEVLKNAHQGAPGEWAFRVNLAQRLAASGDPAAGEALLREATEVEDPRLAHAAWFDLAGFLHGLRDHARAADAIEQGIERIREVDEPGPQDLFRWADALVVSDQFDRALEVAEQISVPSQKALIRGRVAQERGDAEAALEHFDEALRLWPDNPWAHYYAALAAEDAGRFDRALEEYRYAIRIDASATDARTRVARLLAAQGAYQRAYHMLFLEVQKHPLEPEGELFGMYLVARAAVPEQLQNTLLSLAEREPQQIPEALALAAGGVEERVGAGAALELLRGAPFIDYTLPSSAPALRALVRLAHASGQPEAAQQVVDVALAAAPEAPVFQAVLGLHLELGGAEVEKARAAYERALAARPRDATALKGLARLTLPDDPGEAARLFDRAAAADPSDPEPSLIIARMLRAAGQVAPARQRLEALIDAHPFEAAAAVELVEIDLAEGEASSETLTWARRALRFATSPEAFERLARVHEALGNVEEAKRAAERAERLRERRLAREQGAEDEAPEDGGPPAEGEPAPADGESPAADEPPTGG